MPFAVAHTVELAGTATPEPSPNAQPPLAPRRFPSPSIGTGQVHAAVGWTEGASAPVSFELWVLAAPLTKWFRVGTRTTTADGEPADGIIVPAEAELVVRVTAAPVVGALRFGFRAPAADDAVSAGDVAELPDPIAPGDADPNDPATYVLLSARHRARCFHSHLDLGVYERAAHGDDRVAQPRRGERLGPVEGQHL